MICKYCKKEMRLDDVDYNFSGNKDNYWICDHHKDAYVFAVEKIRYGKSIKVDFSYEEKE